MQFFLQNILFESDSEDAKLKLVDFGFARILPNSNKSLITPCCGTLAYAAPEVLEIQDELPQYNQQCDLWSLGVILYTMICGKGKEILVGKKNNFYVKVFVSTKVKIHAEFFSSISRKKYNGISCGYNFADSISRLFLIGANLGDG